MGLWFVEEVRALCGLRVLHIRWLDLRRCGMAVLVLAGGESLLVLGGLAGAMRAKLPRKSF
jgi:hypothetical protein